MEINNTTSSPNHDIPDKQIWQLPIVYLIGILGILGNGTVFIVFLANPKSMKKLSSLYIFHQTIIDLSSSVIFLAYRTHVYYQERGFLAGTTWIEVLTCKLWYSGYILWAMLLTSNLNLTLLSLERYFAICHPVIHRNKYNAKKVKITMVVIWVIGISYQTYIIAVHDINEYGFCTPQWGSKPVQLIMGVITFLVEFLIPLSVMIFAYNRIIYQLKTLAKSYTLRRQAVAMSVHVAPDSSTSPSSKVSPSDCLASSTISPIDTSTLQSPTRSQLAESGLAQVQVRASRSPTLVMFSKAKYNATKTLCFVFITFVICWTPAELEYLIDNFQSENKSCYMNCESIVDAVVTNILLLNMIVNPFIYAITLKEFQDNFKKTFSSFRCSLPSINLPCKLKLRVFPKRRTSYSPRADTAQVNDNDSRNVVLIHHQPQSTETYNL